jgi:hypothetical protein
MLGTMAIFQVLSYKNIFCYWKDDNDIVEKIFFIHIENNFLSELAMTLSKNKTQQNENRQNDTQQSNT